MTNIMETSSLILPELRTQQLLEYLKLAHPDICFFLVSCV